MEKEFKKLHIGFLSIDYPRTRKMFSEFIKENSDIIETVIEDRKVILKDGTTISSFYFLIDKVITCDVKIDQLLLFNDSDYRSMMSISMRHRVDELLEDSCVPSEYRIISCE